MPVEIKELIIRAVVEQGPEKAPAQAAMSAPGPAGTAGAASTPAADAQEVLIEACVRQVLRILDKSRER